MFDNLIRGFLTVIYSVLHVTTRRSSFTIELFTGECYAPLNVDKHVEEAVQVDLDRLFIPVHTLSRKLARATDFGCSRIGAGGDSWRISKLLLRYLCAVIAVYGAHRANFLY